jgi:hypothetical protein
MLTKSVLKPPAPTSSPSLARSGDDVRGVSRLQPTLAQRLAVESASRFRASPAMFSQVAA